MKLHLRFSAIIIIFLTFFSSFSQTTYRVDERRIYSWNGTPDWKHDITEQYTYVNGGNKATKIVATSISTMLQVYQHIKSYNSNNDIILDLKQTWDGSQWVNDSQDTYTYYAGTSNIKDITTFSFHQGFDVSKVLYEYSGTDITKITFQDGSSGTLINYEKFEYTYNSPGQPNQELKSTWNTSINLWDIVERSTATYVGGLRTELLVESYNGSSYDLFERYLSSYSGSLETEYLQQSWNGSSYDNSDRELSTYDGNDNKTVYIFENWSMGAWVPYYKEENDFSVAGPLSTESFNSKNIKVYPNPVTNVLNISSTSVVDNVEMYNVMGEKVMQTSDAKQLNLYNLKSGIYLLKVFSNNRSIIKKILVK
ncbi:T9SS type A sorting domain-containing protein [Seonamhaeicola sp.]|uniref:T9SS type A sorting domain-containing protein n=1 Tax=Seonamhaeicola sp. TaxID=1912245 RepID=UPI00262481F7|nr:T9SS type A sorting domain-containing protein [Seonamhaeicola sp.]